MEANIVAKVGDFVKPDGWVIGEVLRYDDGFRDSCFPGCQFRMASHYGHLLAVNIKITGKVLNKNGMYRCQIEFVGDGEPSNFYGGWIKIREEENQNV